MMPRDSVVSGGGSLPKGLEVFQEQTMYIYISIYIHLCIQYIHMYLCVQYMLCCVTGVWERTE